MMVGDFIGDDSRDYQSRYGILTEDRWYLRPDIFGKSKVVSMIEFPYPNDVVTVLIKKERLSK